MTTKKIENFDLDFSAMTATKSEATSEIPVVTANPTKKVKSGTWINGKEIKDVDPDEFKEWIFKLLPNPDTQNLPSATFKSVDDKVNIIDRMVWLYTQNVFYSDKQKADEQYKSVN